MNPKAKGYIFNKKKKEKAIYALSKSIMTKLDQIYDQTKDAVGK